MLREVRYFIGATEPELNNVELQVYTRGGNGPVTLLYSQTLNVASDMTVGDHTITLNNVWLNNSNSFCVGLAAPNNGKSGALGVAVDTNSSSVGVSYLKLEASGACYLPQWNDVLVLKPNPHGNWCITAKIMQ